MKKTIITTLAISAISFAFAQTQEARQVEAPKMGTQQINALKANMMKGQATGVAQGMPQAQAGSMMDFMTTGDKAVDEKLKVLMKERDEKLKAIQEDYQAKIKSLMGERKLMPKAQNGTQANPVQGMQKKVEAIQGKEGYPGMKMEEGRQERRSETMEAKQQKEERMENMMKNNPRPNDMMEAKEVEAPANPFSKIQGMFKGVFGN